MATKDIYELGVAVDATPSTEGIGEVTRNLRLVGDEGELNIGRVEKTFLRLGGHAAGVNRELVTLVAEMGAAGALVAAPIAAGVLAFVEYEKEVKKAAEELAELTRLTNEAYDAFIKFDTSLEDRAAHAEEEAALTGAKTEQQRQQIIYQREYNRIIEEANDIFNSKKHAIEDDNKLTEDQKNNQIEEARTLRDQSIGLADVTARRIADADAVRQHNEQVKEAARLAEERLKAFEREKETLQEHVLELQSGERAAYAFGIAQKVAAGELTEAQGEQLVALNNTRQSLIELQEEHKKLQHEQEEAARKAEESARRMEAAYVSAIDKIASALGRLNGPLGKIASLGGSIFGAVKAIDNAHTQGIG